MHPIRKLLDALKEADEAGQVAYVQYLCEDILSKEPDHGPTLIRYAGALIDLAHYEEAAAVLDRAESVVPDGLWHLIHAERGHVI